MIFSLLPTLVYVITVYQYAAPVGNIDLGGIAGSYIGLFFLASGFVCIGVFASSLADNQLVAFIIAMFLCLLCYTYGFQSVATIFATGVVANLIDQLGIVAHYNS